MAGTKIPTGANGAEGVVEYESTTFSADGAFTGGTVRVTRIGKNVTVSLENPLLNTTPSANPFDGNSAAAMTSKLPTSMRPAGDVRQTTAVTDATNDIGFSLRIASIGEIFIIAHLGSNRTSLQGAFCNANINGRANPFTGSTIFSVSYVIA